MKPLSSIYTKYLPSRAFKLAAFGVLITLILAVPLFGQWEPDVRLTYDDSLSLLAWCYNPRCIAAGPSGALHLVWYDTRDGGEYAEEIYYERSTDCGTTWSADFRLSVADGYRSRAPSVCVEGSNVHVVWYDEHSGNLDILYKRSSDGGVNWTVEMPLGTAFQGPPSIAACGSYLHAVWVVLNNQNSTREIWYNKSMDTGMSWSGAIKLTNPITPEADVEPLVSASGPDVHVIWRRYNSTYGYNIYCKYSTDHGVTWSQDESLLSWHTVMYLSHALSDSIIHVVWMDGSAPGGQIYYKRSMDRGMTWQQEVQLSDSLYSSNFSSICASGLNTHVIYEGHLEGYSGSNLYYKFSSDGGVTWSTQSLLTTDTITPAGLYPSISIGDTMVHMVWQDGRHGHPYTGNREIYYKRNPTGNAWGIYENSAGNMQQIPTGLIAFPNPFTSYTSIFGYKKHSFVLYDITGKRVGIFRGDRIGQGLSAGVYFLTSEGENAQPLRVVKVR